MAEIATIARPYAEALFQAAGADAAGTAVWLDELAAVASNEQLRQFAARRGACHPDRYGAVGEHAGLEDIGIGLTVGARILPRTGPAERLEHIDDRLRPRQIQARAVALVRRRCEHPCAARTSEVERVFGRAHTVDIEVHGLDGERFSGRGKKRIDELLGRDAPRPLNPWIRRRIFPGAYPPTLAEVTTRVLAPAGMSV